MEYKIGKQFLNCIASNYLTINSLECARNMNVFDDKYANDIIITKMIYMDEKIMCFVLYAQKSSTGFITCRLLYSLRHQLIDFSQLVFFLLLNHVSLNWKRGNDKIGYKLYCSIFLLPVY